MPRRLKGLASGSQFQWGSMSTAKWERKASGKPTNGLGMAATTTIPTKA